MSVIKQPFQMIPFSPSIDFQWRLREDCYNDICDVPIIPKGKFIPFAIIANSDNVGAITLHCHDEPFSYTRSEYFTKNNCETGFGNPISFSKTYYSTVSYLDARQQGLTDANYLIEGQQYANDYGTCIGIGNTEQSQTFNKSDCAEDYVGSEVIYTVNADTYFAGTVEEANQLALDDIAANGQSYANTNGTCLSRYLVNIDYHETEPEGTSILSGGISMVGTGAVASWTNSGGNSIGHGSNGITLYLIGQIFEVHFNLDLLKSRNLIIGKTYRMVMLFYTGGGLNWNKTYYVDTITSPIIFTDGAGVITQDFIFNGENPLTFIIKYTAIANYVIGSFNFSYITLKQLN